MKMTLPNLIFAALFCLFPLGLSYAESPSNADSQTVAGDVQILSTEAERAHLPKNLKSQAIFLEPERLKIVIAEALSEKKALWIQLKNEWVNVLPLSYEPKAQRIIGLRQDSGARVVIRQAPEVETAAR